MKRRKVYVDASYRDGVAGLAVVGAMGLHTKGIMAPDNNYAEIAALDWAICMAAEQKLTDLRFFTDSSNAAEKYKHLNSHNDIVVQRIPRGHNHEANRHARRVMRMMAAMVTV